MADQDLAFSSVASRAMPPISPPMGADCSSAMRLEISPTTSLDFSQA